MENKKLAAVFFFSKEKQETPQELVGKLALDISVSNEPIPCEWGGFKGDFHCSETTDYFIFLITFWQSEFLNAIVEIEDNGLNMLEMPLVSAFGKAVNISQPDVAYIATHLDQATMSFAKKLEWAVLSLDANSLSNERLGLLYLSPQISQYWTNNPLRDDRIELINDNVGRIIFAGKGNDLWF